MVISTSPFLPTGLVQGSNTIDVRAFDASGRRGPSSSIAITYDTTPPPAVTGLVVGPGGLVQFQPAGPGDVYEYSVGNSSTFLPLGTATSFTDPTILNAPGTVRVRAVDLAGNVGPVATAGISIESSPGARGAGRPAARPTRSPSQGRRSSRSRRLRANPRRPGRSSHLRRTSRSGPRRSAGPRGRRLW